MLNIGCHLSASNGYSAMAKQAIEIHANTFQFFTRNPRGFKAKCIDKKDITEFLQIVQENNFMHLDINTRLNLEITESLSERKRFGSLLWVLDKTLTPMGARKLRNYLEHPLQDYTLINDRLDAVEELVKDNLNRTVWEGKRNWF